MFLPCSLFIWCVWALQGSRSGTKYKCFAVVFLPSVPVVTLEYFAGLGGMNSPGNAMSFVAWTLQGELLRSLELCCGISSVPWLQPTPLPSDVHQMFTSASKAKVLQDFPSGSGGCWEFRLKKWENQTFSILDILDVHCAKAVHRLWVWLHLRSWPLVEYLWYFYHAGVPWQHWNIELSSRAKAIRNSGQLLNYYFLGPILLLASDSIFKACKNERNSAFHVSEMPLRLDLFVLFLRGACTKCRSVVEPWLEQANCRPDLCFSKMIMAFALWLRDQVSPKFLSPFSVKFGMPHSHSARVFHWRLRSCSWTFGNGASAKTTLNPLGSRLLSWCQKIGKLMDVSFRKYARFVRFSFVFSLLL